jgi:hypothetical protein
MEVDEELGDEMREEDLMYNAKFINDVFVQNTLDATSHSI